ncbi:NAD(P)/FAD-dependent oxidoreductase [Mycoplasma struthionis]|uniref:FAD-binding protein n=1 Tax=Mycoplasma struthionis TaxID=538220 RepID=A0A3G8LGC7_9MOLU|nr:FAD-dependent oxidoreductase [Mycoplasma struthionis]AZG68719.1 FAD-binding protein [Mycoplasma struthionis]
MQENKIYDVLIIGAGPAGLTAAVYLSRNGTDVAFIEGYMPGGKMAEQSKIENYPGFNLVSGIELSTRMLNQAKENGAQFIYGFVNNIETENELKKITLNNGNIYYSKFVIIATGMKNLVPKTVINIEKFRNKGVSYCVLCDGALYKNKECAIIGGGNSAFEEGAYLASMASKVYVFIRDGIIAEKRLVEDLKKLDNVEILENSEILELYGENELDGLKAKVNNEEKEFKEIKAVFPYIGFKPATEFLNNKNLLNERGFIIVNDEMETLENNIFAIGDVTVKSVRQITTATNDGTIAAKVINSRLSKK